LRTCKAKCPPQKAAATKTRLLCLFLLALALIVVQLVAARDLTQDDINFRKEVYVNKKGDRLPYRLFVPLGIDKTRKYPLILWLHDGGGRGSDNLKQLTKDNQLATHFWISKPVQDSFPVLLMVPQCPANENWAEPELNQPGEALQLTMEALAKVQREFPVDPDRIYVGGQGMGGIGVWSLLQKYPGMWAGATIISAYDNFTDVGAVARVPLWVFQGDQDDSVPVTMVRDMMQQLKKANANVRYTEYHKIGRTAWERAFAEPELASWLSAQRRMGSAGGQVGSGAPSSNR
jgi:predicted peptidase